MLSVYYLQKFANATQDILEKKCGTNTGPNFLALEKTKMFGSFYNGTFPIVQYIPGVFAYWYGSYTNYSCGFTGCAMAKFIYNGYDYVCHIAIDENNTFRPDQFGDENPKWKTIKNKVRFNNIFFPFYGKTDALYCNIKKDGRTSLNCIGIIQGNNCYSLLYNCNTKKIISIEEWILPMNEALQNVYDNNGRRLFTQYSKQFKLL